MNLSIDYKEIEALILANTGLEITIQRVAENEIRFQPRNMGFIKNRIKVSVRIDNTYMEPNRIKFVVSAGAFSNMIVPKVMDLLSYMPEGSVARQDNGVVNVMFDMIPQLENVLSFYVISEINFWDAHLSIEAEFSNKSGVNVNAIPPILEDCWDSNTSIKDREIGNTFIGIARSIFESDKVDEGIQTLSQKAKELKDTHGEELRDAVLSLIKNLRSNGKSTSPDDKVGE